MTEVWKRKKKTDRDWEGWKAVKEKKKWKKERNKYEGVVRKKKKRNHDVEARRYEKLGLMNWKLDRIEGEGKK